MGRECLWERLAISLRSADAFPVVASLPPKNRVRVRVRRERSDDRKCVCASQATLTADRKRKRRTSSSPNPIRAEPARVREGFNPLFSTREERFRISVRPCNILYVKNYLLCICYIFNKYFYPTATGLAQS